MTSDNFLQVWLTAQKPHTHVKTALPSLTLETRHSIDAMLYFLCAVLSELFESKDFNYILLFIWLQPSILPGTLCCPQRATFHTGALNSVFTIANIYSALCDWVCRCFVFLSHSDVTVTTLRSFLRGHLLQLSFAHEEIKAFKGQTNDGIRISAQADSRTFLGIWPQLPSSSYCPSPVEF